MLSGNCRRYCAGFAAVALLVAVAGCPEEQATETAGEPPAPVTEIAKAAEPVTESIAEVEAKLAKADALDGTADKVVTKCASCALGMDGSAEHSVKVLDYTMHFCTEGCAKTFAEDTTKSVLAMSIPES